MGRNPSLNFRNLILLALGVGLLSHDIPADARPRATQQSYPMISLRTDLARDADTYADDKTLVESCTAKGQSQKTCLCVTHILKYELTLSEYKAAVRLYDTKSETILAALRQDGITQADIQTAQDVTEGLTQDKDFPERCDEARAYYRP